MMLFRYCFFAWMFAISVYAQSQHSPIFPQPQNYRFNEELFQFTGKLTVAKNSQIDSMLPYFQEQFQQQFGLQLSTVTNDEPMISLSVAKSSQPGYYRLVITNAGIRIESNDYQGLFYAFQSLLQQTVSAEEINGVEIEDWPAFGYRGVHLDCARHFFTIAELEGFIDEIARLKFNKFHWHLTDDQGWRLEIKKYPKLTEIGGWRDRTLMGHFSDIPDMYELKRYGGFYTQEEAKKLIVYAKIRGIEIIPEIEMPGHARAALAAYPELGCTGKQQPVADTWGVFDDVFCSKEQTLKFLEDVLDELVAVFPSKTIHIGGDESPKTRWKVCPACQQQIKDHGLHDEHELQSYVVQRMSAYLSSKGRTLIGWDEILEGGLAENAQVMSWRGTEGGIAAAKQKHKVVMTPTSYCYFDYYQSGLPGEPLAIGGFLPLEKVYAFNPVPTELNQVEANYILGGQANLWTEYLPTMKAVQYSVFPRLVAMSEVLWTKEDQRKDYPDFVRGVVSYVFPYYDSKGINYSTAALQPKLEFESKKSGVRILSSSLVPDTYTLIKTDIDPEGSSGHVFMQTNEVETVPMTVVIVKDTVELRADQYRITTHMALGKKVDFVTQPSGKYNVNGNLGLTDGITGALPWKGHQWLGFEEDTVRFELDLGSKVTFGSAVLGTLNDPGSWIYRPLEVKVEYRKKATGKWKATYVTNYREGKFCMDQKLKARYLRFTVINNEKIPEGLPGAGFTPWTFLDELIISK